MKRPLLVAALLAATPLLALPGRADPLQMFSINTPSAGVVNFSGTGTASFNQSIGTNNALSVGSNTGLGVNAAASSTADYMSMGSATLNLDGSSRMQQTIGTATSAFNASTAAESSSKAAHTTAQSRANSSSYGTEWTNEWNSTYSREQGWEYKDDGTNPAGYYEIGGEAGYQTVDEWEASSKSAWKTGWERNYNQAYERAFTTAMSSATEATSGASNTGTIVADFSTKDAGDSSSALGALTASFEAGAAASADASVGASYESSTYNSQAEYDAAWEAEYQSSYSAAYNSANASVARESHSAVELQGIGSIADVNAQSTSTFLADSQLIDVAIRDGNGNGNASAGASLSTTSHASQSNATTASAFMQAFAGGTPQGDLTITGVTGNSTDGWEVTGTRTVTTTESYSVVDDVDGGQSVTQN